MCTMSENVLGRLVGTIDGSGLIRDHGIGGALRSILAVAVWLVACTGTDGTGSTDLIYETDDSDLPYLSGCEVGRAPRLAVGKGERAFEASEDDEGRSVLIHGLQGGFHTFVSLRGAHLSLEERWKVEIEGRVGEEVWASAVLERTPECNPDADQAEANGTWLIWVGRRPPELHEQEVTIWSRVEDADGRTVEATAVQRIWDPALAE